MTTNAPRKSASTVKDILEKTTAFFQSKDITTARLDTEIILSETLGFDRLRLYLNLDRPLDDVELDKAREMVRRRALREPMAYIIGIREFFSRPFKVRPGVLIPRPETEFLVEATLDELKKRFPEESAPAILEFGVGSGAIAVTLAAEIPDARLTATDISPIAKEVAEENAALHGVADRLNIILSPTLDGIAPFSDGNSPGQFHAIVSNPPYIDPADLPTLEDDVAKYEPHEALFAEENGLHWYRYLCDQAGEMLLPNGFLALEIGLGQGDAVREFAEKAGLVQIKSVKDYAQIERTLVFAPKSS